MSGICILPPSPNMVASAKKNKNGRTISLTDFMTEDGMGGLVEEAPMSLASQLD
jgi:hypothetical protein